MKDSRIILLVDDSRLYSSSITKILIKSGYKVLHASDGNNGVKKACYAIPDLVLCDIEMPDMNGYEVCRRLKSSEKTSSIPVVFLSCKSSGVDIDKAFDVGANDFLCKPVDQNELLSRIKLILTTKDDHKRREKILIVDDSLMIRNLMKQGLSQQGFEVITGVNGQEGLSLAHLHKPDLVVTDFNMPLMNGRDLTREIRKISSLSDIPVLMLTASDSDVDRAKGEHAGVSIFLSKPFPPDKLVVIVEKLIAEQKMYREREVLEHYVSEPAISAARKAAESRSKVDNMRADKVFSTVLFTDIVGFTLLTERNSPDELLTLLNSYLDLMSTVLNRNHAIIDKFIGDSVMALFPQNNGMSKQQNAFNAVKSGLEMIEVLREFNLIKKTCQNDEISMRVGISSGEVIMGDIGSVHYRRDYSVIGNKVNLASKLEGHAQVNSVLISDETYCLNKDRIEVEKSMYIKISGDENNRHLVHHVAKVKG